MNQVIVTSAVKLESSLKSEVLKTIEAKLSGSEYELHEEVDPSILGGIRLQINSNVYDASVMGKLSALQATSR